MSADRAILFRLITSARLERAVRAAPPGERLAWRAASRYVAGTTAAAAIEVAQRMRDRGVSASIDQFGELVRETATAGRQAIWTSRDGLSWTLAATHGITPQLRGDRLLVINATAGGFLAGGQAAADGGGTQGVIWTSRDGLSWQRMTAARLGLAGPGEIVQDISYATSRGPDTLISGTVTSGGTTYSGVWLSTGGGTTWTRVTVPADHGAGTTLAGLAFDGSGPDRGQARPFGDRHRRRNFIFFS